jgi:cytosine/adenosine deaminase-related metal-dependent hydrolase
MKHINGEILTLQGFEKYSLPVDIVKTENTSKVLLSKHANNILVLPTFVNMHTHIGDTFIRKKRKNLPRDIKKLVAPPDGLKHRLLNEAPDHEIISGMQKSIDEMIRTGTSLFCDFREQGIEGVNHLKEALRGKKDISCIILSRPKDLSYDKEEIDLLLKNSHGIGISGISDWKYDELKKIAKYAHSNSKIFALHASETKRENIDSILDLKPDFLIHMVYATKEDLDRVADNGIPVVICPRSNNFFGLKLNLEKFKNSGVTLMLGTDNAMINSPNMIDEIKYLLSISKNIFTLREILTMSTYTPRKVLKQKCDIPKNLDNSFIALDKKSLKPIAITQKLG